ncbi:MAG: minor capsid protein [Zoogloeaceae bacterium]|jgi:SPP1 gp7 family putative phage head morphogenesis protein|nr:minor capsid protein [Zoogloeaceae bacterium]
MSIFARLDLPPADAIAFFEKKGMHLSWDWHDTDAATHAQSFTVAKVTSLDMLGWFQNEIGRSLKEGRTFEDFKKSLRPRLSDAGWWGKKEMLDADTGELTQVQLGSNRRLRTIFQTNVQTSYMAGRYKQYLDNAENRPYWRYVAVMDSRTRAGHAALNGKVWRADDPIWQTLWPPNGWGCRCRVQALSAAEFEKSGRKLEDSRDAIVEKEVTINRDGDTMQVKGIRYVDDAGKEKVFWPDPGWDHNPALAQSDELQALLKEKAEKLVAKYPASSASVQAYATGWNPKTVAGAWHDASFAGAPDDIRSAITKVGDPGDVLHTPNASAYYLYRQHIEMDGANIKLLRGQSTWRHEFGHHADVELAQGKPYLYTSSSDVFDAAMRADRKALIDMGAHGPVNSKKTLARRAALDFAYDGARQDSMAATDREAWLSARYQKSGIDYTSARAAIEKHAAFPELLDAAAAQDRYRRVIVALEERDAQGLMDALTGGLSAKPISQQTGPTSWKLVYEKTKAFEKGTLGALSDLFGSATRNKVGGTKSGWGHINAYYARAPHKAGTESFANLFCLHGEGGLFWKQVLERMTPEMNRAFLELLK